MAWTTHSDTGSIFEFHQLQKQIALLQCGCFVLLWLTRKSQHYIKMICPFIESAFYYEQDKKDKGNAVFPAAIS